MQVKFKKFNVFDEFTRPNNTDIYGFSFVYTNSTTESQPLVFENIVDRNGGACILTDIRITISSAQTIRPVFRLYLFNKSPSIPNDNSSTALSIEDANSIQLVQNTINTSMNTTSTIITASNLSALCKTASNDRNLYGCLELIGIYPSTANEKVRVNLRGFLLN